MYNYVQHTCSQVQVDMYNIHNSLRGLRRIYTKEHKCPVSARTKDRAQTWTDCPPQIYLGGVTFTLFYGGTVCSHWTYLALSTEPPLHLDHTLGGELSQQSLAYRYTMS